MDINRFATRKNANEGVWVEPVIFGEKMGVEFCVIGADSDEARKFLRVQSREINAMTKPERERIDWTERSKLGTAARIKDMRVVGGGDVMLDGEKIENTSAGYMKLFTEIPEVQDFIWSFTEERSSFLSNPKESLKKQ